MDFFERAHVPRKSPSKMENKAVKTQLKQMLHAYKKGNNEGIRTSSEIKPKYDFDDPSKYSDFYEVTPTKEAKNYKTTTDSNTSGDLQSSIIPNDSGESNNDEETPVDISISEDFSLTTSSASASLRTPSNELEESDFNVSELSLPSSLCTGSTETNSDSEEFDADKVLASKILDKLDNKFKPPKRKILKEVENEVKKDVKPKPQPAKKVEIKKKAKKPKAPHNNSTEYFTEEDFSATDISPQVFHDLHVLRKDTSQTKKKLRLKVPLMTDFSDSDNNTIESASSISSLTSQFVSVSAEDVTFTQSLGELVGGYVYPTIRNMPSDKSNIVPSRAPSKMFPADTLTLQDIEEDIEEDISSLIPEVDDIDLEDLNIDADTQEMLEESNTLNDTIATDISDITTDEDVQIKLYQSKQEFVLLMKHPSELYIHGKVQISAINGSAEILGYKLNYNSVDVFAPYSHFAQCLKTTENLYPVNPELSVELKRAGLPEKEVNEIMSNINEQTAVVLLSKLDSSQLDFVANNFDSIDLFSRRGDSIPQFLRKASDTLGCSLYVRPPRKSFEEKEIWADVYSSVICRREGSRGIICGGKSTGKSTFLRHYVNTLLSDGPILVLDLDPGQAEFTVPGNVSATVVDEPLLGPSFTHLKTPEKMLNIGIINTMDNANRYLSAVTELIAHCRADDALRELPWIVNTMGMCNHLGLQFLTYTVLQIQPTFLFQIDAKMQKKRFDVELDPIAVTQLYEKYSKNRFFKSIQNPYCLRYSYIIARPDESPPQRVKSNGYSLMPRDERYLNVLAYFGQLLEDRTVDLLDLVPYEVPLNALSIGLNVKIPADCIAKVINGKIVALCQQNGGDKSTVFTLGDRALLCHGHGLIRNIDFGKGVLYILTPTPIGKLNYVDTLVYSDWMPELRGQERDPLPNGTTIPYRTANTEIYQRKLMFPPRRRFNPLQLLRMSRNT